MSVILKVVGIALIALGIIGALGVMGSANPISMVSNPLFNFSRLFLTDSAAFLLWVFVFILGLTLAGPSGGFIKSIAKK